MRYFLSIFLVFFIVYADETDVDIKANNFTADKSKNIIIFTGKVAMVKGEDTLFCDKLTVYTKNIPNSTKTVIQNYIAVGHVNMKLKRPTTIMIGRGDKVTYDVDNMIYVITGDGYLEDTVGQKIVKGEKIYYDEKNENTNIDGGKNKPVQFKLKIESK
ncbi:MAG: LptA/OstA family protein [Arcobacteraceae bacterium]|nr:LptA/OstA family protein [Arcobacteraceae bacterium]